MKKIWIDLRETATRKQYTFQSVNDGIACGALLTAKHPRGFKAAKGWQILNWTETEAHSSASTPPGDSLREP